MSKTLEGYGVEEPLADGHSWFRHATGPGVFVFDPSFTSSTIPYAAARRAYGIPATPPSYGIPPTPSAYSIPATPPPFIPAVPRVRPRRTLSLRQQQALGLLIELGGSIGADFTDRELRSMFRALARRYHPDRHPGASEQERTRLSRLFAQLHEAYDHLQVVPAAAA